MSRIMASPGGAWTSTRFGSATAKTHAFVLRRGTFTTIDVPGAVATFGRGINARGDIVGNYIDGTGTHGFLATE